MQLIKSILEENTRVFKEYKPLSANVVLDSNGQELINFSSTQYLGIPWREDFNQCVSKLNIVGSVFGSLGSNYLGGTHESRLALENKISQLLNSEATLCFSSGWSANYSICEYLGKCYDIVISDIRNHNSIISGLKTFKGKKLIVDLDTTDVSAIIQNYKNKRIALIYTTIEGIAGIRTNPYFSNSHDRKKITIISDECHSFGIDGVNGLSSEFSRYADIRILGFSKAIGIMGSAVVSTSEIIHNLSQYSSPWVYSTAVPPIIWDITSVAIDIMLGCNMERRTIKENSVLFRKLLQNSNIRFTGSLHITGVHFPIEINPKIVESELKKHGFLIIVSEPPTTRNGEKIARIAIQPGHSKIQIEHIAKAIHNCIYI